MGRKNMKNATQALVIFTVAFIFYSCSGDGDKKSSTAEQILHPKCNKLTGIFVNPKVLKSGDGSSWEKAYKTIQEAVESVEARDKDIIVAKGIYKGEPPNNPVIHINRKTSIIGGYSADDNCQEDRDLKNKIAILDGVKSLHHVVVISNYRERVGRVSLDGLKIVNGNVPKEENSSYGAGIFAYKTDNLILKNTIFEGNKSEDGGALFFEECNDAQIIDSQFNNNNSSDMGGALVIYKSERLIISKSIFQDNTGAKIGGAIFITESNGFRISDSLFRNNTSEKGGAIVILDSLAGVISNSIFDQNVEPDIWINKDIKGSGNTMDIARISRIGNFRRFLSDDFFKKL